MKVFNLESPRTGHPVANQFVIVEKGGIMGNFESRETFQSYQTVIAIKTVWGHEAIAGGQVDIVLDAESWDFSRTTLKYLGQFLGNSWGGLTKKEIQAKINSGEYKLENLNK